MSIYKPPIKFEINKGLIDEAKTYVNYFYYGYKDRLNISEVDRLNLEIAVDSINHLANISKETNHNYWPSIEAEFLRLTKKGLQIDVGKFLSNLNYSEMISQEDKENLQKAIATAGNLYITIDGMLFEARIFKRFFKPEITQ